MRFLRWLLTPRQAPPHHRDAIVVLGAALRADNTLTPAARERVEVGVGLLREGLGDRLVVSGGVGRFSRHSKREASAMADHALSLGAEEERLIVEAESQDTAENARNTAQLLPPGARVWIVTQPFHLRRAVLWFRRVGLDPEPWVMTETIQFADPRRELRWLTRECLSLVRDLTIRQRVPRGTSGTGPTG